jgi:signal transduction histidine kinase/CheY-like chemotaxis protein
MIGQPISAIVPADRLEEHERNMARVRAGTEVHRLETERVRKDGRRLAVSLTISPLRDAKGEVFGSSTVARDVTERNALAERLLHSQKLESLGTMAGGVAHDFNNILTTIIGYTDLMKLDMCEECPVRPSLAPIEHASAQAKSLTGSLLAFSRKQVMSPAAIRVNDLVEAFTGILGRLIGEHIELVLDLCPSNPAVLVESSQIGQVLMNLAMNARDAMPTGGTLTIATRPCQPVRAGAAGREDDSASGVRITVSDTGTGIDGALRDRIFEPFFTTKSRGRGTGLGLSLAYGIVEQHGGSLRLEPGDAPGATFSISLPVVADPEFPEAEPGSGPMPRGRECVLLVEDNADVRGLGRSVLERHGYCVLEARDGQHAIEILAERARDIDLVLSDVVMPRRSGREVFDTAARLRPELPVILTSGYLDEAIPMEWIQREGRDFLPKPTTPSQLLCKVRTVLDRGR